MFGREMNLKYESKPALQRRVEELQRQVRQLEAELAGVRKDYDRLLRGAQPLVPDPVDFEGLPR